MKMDSLHRSVGIFFLVCGLGCAQASRRAGSSAGGEVSLLQDQRSLEELRQNVPPEKRQKNDELKELLSLTGPVDEPPERVRERFQTLTRKHRQDFMREHKRRRELFNQRQKEEANKFKNEMDGERAKIRDRKLKREDASRAYADLEGRRKYFYGKQDDERRFFDLEQRQISDQFQSDMREKNEQFNQEMRQYTKRYEDLKREKKSDSVDLEEFEKMKSVPGTRLAPQESDD